VNDRRPVRDLGPPEFLQLVGHPLRWRLLGELAGSDRSVHELVARIGEPQNLVSYHLGKLRDAGVVSTRRSSADRRDAYYSADLRRIRDLLAHSGGSLHPALRLAPPQVDVAASSGARVLFLCTGNSARSQIAEAFARERSGGAVEACSAGSHPKALHANAVRVMKEDHGIDLAGRSTKHLDVFADQRFDRVVSLCDRVREVCPEFPGTPRLIHWSLADPAAGGAGDDATYPAFRQLAAEVAIRVELLLADLAEPADRTTAA
jgi:ArsR family transcriptional regulator, arsenate/arsenite/antimonite-responsive transcriptional repressor / arsenate reductase (thioredoxin)